MEVSVLANIAEFVLFLQGPKVESARSSLISYPDPFRIRCRAQRSKAILGVLKTVCITHAMSLVLMCWWYRVILHVMMHVTRSDRLNVRSIVHYLPAVFQSIGIVI